MQSNFKIIMPLFAIALLGGIEMIFCREKLIIISWYLPKLVVEPHEDLIHGFVILKTVQKNVLKFLDTSKMFFFVLKVTDRFIIGLCWQNIRNNFQKSWIFHSHDFWNMETSQVKLTGCENTKTANIVQQKLKLKLNNRILVEEAFKRKLQVFRILVQDCEWLCVKLEGNEHSQGAHQKLITIERFRQLEGGGGGT